MTGDITALLKNVDAALQAGRPADAICYLAELVAAHPEDRHTRTALAISIGDAGYPAGALKVLRALAGNLAHRGFLLPALVIIRFGLAHAPNDDGLLSTLRRLHVRGVRAKAGNLPMPPPLKSTRSAPGTMTAAALLELEPAERFARITEIGCDFGPQNEAAMPLPMPLFCELDEEAFIETVRQLRYKRVPKGTQLLVEGEIGNHLLVVASGRLSIVKGGQPLAKVGPGTVLGEMALLTGAPRSATAVAEEEVELFELMRADVEKLAQAKPGIAEELMEYCRKRLVGNLLSTSPLFKRFDDATRFALVDRFKRVAYQQGQAVITQGQAGTGLFVIAAGEVQVTVARDGGEPTVVANLGPGDVFGEISLLYDQPTNASVKATTRVGTLFLPRDEFAQVLDEHPTVKEYLLTLSADRVYASATAQESPEILDADDLIVL